jgi:hypothetical protein
VSYGLSSFFADSILSACSNVTQKHSSEVSPIRLDGVKLPDAKRGFALLPGRWVVERTLPLPPEYQKGRSLAGGFFPFGAGYDIEACMSRPMRPIAQSIVMALWTILAICPRVAEAEGRKVPSE